MKKVHFLYAILGEWHRRKSSKGHLRPANQELRKVTPQLKKRQKMYPAGRIEPTTIADIQRLYQLSYAA